MDNKEFYDTVKKLREQQRLFFREHDKNTTLRHCKDLEQVVDEALQNDGIPTLESAKHFRAAVWLMRKLQRSFFAHYSKDILAQAKRQERVVDKWINTTESNIVSKMQPTLNFGG